MNNILGFMQAIKEAVGEFLLLLYNEATIKRKIPIMDKRGNTG